MTDDWGDVNTGEWGSSIKTTGPPQAEKPKTQKSEKPEKSKKASNQKISEKKPDQKVTENQPKKKRNRNKFKPGYEPKRPKIDLENSQRPTQPSKPVESKPVRPKKVLEGQKAEKPLNKKFENKSKGPKEKKKRVRKSRNKFKQGIDNSEQKSEKSENETPSEKIEEIEENPIEEDSEVNEAREEARRKRLELRNRLTNQLQAAEFRFINEQLYRAQKENTGKILEGDSAKIYHEGFSAQVKKWPVNPVDLIIKHIKARAPKNHIVADLGCGEAKLALEVKNKVHSFDIIKHNQRVTACDIRKTPLEESSVDLAVFCLSLMAEQVDDFIKEANRILKPSAKLIIAEVTSRIENMAKFKRGLGAYGLEDEMGSVEIPISVRLSGKEQFLKINPEATVGEILEELGLSDATVVLSGTKIAADVKISSLDLSDLTVIDILGGSRLTYFKKPENRSFLQYAYSYICSFFRPRVAEKALETAPKFFFGFCKKCYESGFGIDQFKGLIQFRFRYECKKCSSSKIVLQSSPKTPRDDLRIGECLDCNYISKPMVFSKCSRHNNTLVPLSSVSFSGDVKLKVGSSSICCICFCEEDSLKVWYSKDGTPCHVTCLDCFVRCAAGAILEKRPPLCFVPKIGVVIACPICGATSEENWDCHLIYLCGKQIYDSYQLISTEYHLLRQNTETRIVCPQPKCGAEFLIDGETEDITCPECFYSFCSKCQKSPHPLKTCFQNAAFDDQKSILLLNNMKKCPACGCPAEKSFGCNHMICAAPFCASEWCWECETPWNLECAKNHWNIVFEDEEIETEID